MARFPLQSILDNIRNGFAKAIAADTTLQNNIDAEATARANADAYIQQQVTANANSIININGQLTTINSTIAGHGARLNQAELDISELYSLFSNTSRIAVGNFNLSNSSTNAQITAAWQTKFGSGQSPQETDKVYDGNSNNEWIFDGTNWILFTVNVVTIYGDVTGGSNASTVSKLQGKTLSASNPTANQLLQFNGSAWVPFTPSFALAADLQAEAAARQSADQALQSSLDGKQATLASSASNAISGNQVQRAALTGDVTAPANSNETAIGAGKVTTAKIADANVTTAKLANFQITADTESLEPTTAAGTSQGLIANFNWLRRMITWLKTAVNGKAAASHTHAAADVNSGTLADARIPSLSTDKLTSGTLPVARGGTGANNRAAANNIMSGENENTDFNTNYNCGVYNVWNGWLNPPPGAGYYGTLAVFRASANTTTNNGVTQVYFASDGTILSRNSWATLGSWTAWTKLALASGTATQLMRGDGEKTMQYANNQIPCIIGGQWTYLSFST
jgi:hypothetical protein